MKTYQTETSRRKDRAVVRDNLAVPEVKEKGRPTNRFRGIAHQRRSLGRLRPVPRPRSGPPSDRAAGREGIGSRLCLLARQNRLASEDTVGASDDMANVSAPDMMTSDRRPLLTSGSTRPEGRQIGLVWCGDDGLTKSAIAAEPSS